METRREDDLSRLRLEVREIKVAVEEQRRARRRSIAAVGLLCVAGLALYGGRVLSDPSAAKTCVEGSSLFCFDVDTPAKASEINHNFQQLRDDIQAVASDLQALSDSVDSDIQEVSDAHDADMLLLARGKTRSYSSVVNGSTSDAWYNLFSVNDLTSPVLCNVRAYAHTSVSFIASRGFSSSAPLLTVLHANVSTINAGYKYLKGVRVTPSGIVQIKLSGGSSVSIQAQLIGNGSTPDLNATLARDSNSYPGSSEVDPLVHGGV
jgi:hypothetical protein